MNITILEKRLRMILEREEKYSKGFGQETEHGTNEQVRVRMKGGKAYFSKYAKGHESTLSGRREDVIRLLLAQHDIEKNKVYEYNCTLLKNALSRFRKVKSARIERVLNLLGVEKIPYSLKEWQWMTENFQSNGYMPERLRYVTPAGTKVRSKAEYIIACRLEFYGIAYRYEARLDVKTKVMYPDFTIRKSDGTIVIWEHFGLLDDKEYRDKAMEKIEMYRHKGYKQHSNLICTWEEDIADVKDIDNIIEKFLIF